MIVSRMEIGGEPVVVVTETKEQGIAALIAEANAYSTTLRYYDTTEEFVNDTVWQHSATFGQVIWPHHAPA